MKYIKERIGVIAEQLKALSKVQKFDMFDWQVKKDNFFRPADADASPIPWERFNGRTDHWYGPDEHYWFRTTITVPESMDNKPLWMNFRTQIDEWDDGKNPQFLLFIDGEIIQGLDMYHREVFISPSAEKGKMYQIDLQAYTGTIHSEFRLICELYEANEEIRGLYYDIQVPLWAFARINDEKLKLDLETILNNTINFIDFRKSYSEEFFASVKQARDYIKRALYEDFAGYSDIIATCIGHTHIDVAWWWTVEQTREKTARSFATVLKLMDEYPNYRFISSQPVLYYFLKIRYPELFEKVAARIKEGRWEAEGGMWLEADCNLTSGESLIRQFLHGKRFFKENFGVENNILWLPDVFGYSGALPQIMKKCGIDYFMTTKLSWNQYNKIPFDTFKWRGIDGTEILTHFISTLDVGQSDQRFFTTYNGKLHPDSIMGGWNRYQNKDINNDILISFGYGDGGGGPTRDMLETSVRMEKGLKGIPKVRQEFAGNYFSELETRVKNNKRLKTWEGEFYFEYHRGTYTSMARNKKSNRKSELLLMDLELLSVLAAKKGLPYPQDELTDMWRLVLLNQFHDILPGTSIKEVYEQTAKEYACIAEQAEGLKNERITAIAGRGNEIAVFNTLGFRRDDIVNLGDVNMSAISDKNGNIYPIQRTSDGAKAFLRDLPSKGIKTFEKAADAVTPTVFNVSRNSAETPFYSISFAENGAFISIFDKENNREIIPDGKLANLMRVFEDKPMNYDNWDIEIYYTEKSWNVDELISFEWIENGPVCATLEAAYRFSSSLIKQKIHFYADIRRIDFETYVDWHESQHLLKVFFPCDIHTDEATFDIQFGNVKRKTHRNTSWDVARFESCGHKWVDLSEEGYGISLLNDCKYGHSIYDSEMSITLIKSGIVPNPTTDQEEHSFTYSLYPHSGSWREAETVYEAAKLNQPLNVCLSSEGISDYSLISVDKPNVIIETIKQAENKDGIIVRMYECHNARCTVNISFGEKIISVAECDMLEREISGIDSNENGFSFKILPYEIKTFRIKY